MGLVREEGNERETEVDFSHFISFGTKICTDKTWGVAVSHYEHVSRIDDWIFSHELLFSAKDGIFGLFEGSLENLGSLKQHYGLGKNANEVVLVMEAYRTLRDRAPYPTNHMLTQLDGNFAFIIFDNVNSTVFLASDEDGNVPLYMGITADGYVAFSDDAEILKAACGKSLASFPPGCFFTSSTGLKSYEDTKNTITAMKPEKEEEMLGVTFKIELAN